MLIEFVRQCQARNQAAIQYCNNQEPGFFKLGSGQNVQGQGGLSCFNSQRFNEGSSHEWIEQDQLFEICQRMGVSEWQDIYTEVDVEVLFQKHMVVVNQNEVKNLNTMKTIQLQAISSGVHIGSSNWVLQIDGENELQKYGIVHNVCLEGEYRYPRGIDTNSLKNCDCLLVSSSVFQEQLVEYNL